MNTCLLLVRGVCTPTSPHQDTLVHTNLIMTVKGSAFPISIGKMMMCIPETSQNDAILGGDGVQPLQVNKGKGGGRYDAGGADTSHHDAWGKWGWGGVHFCLHACDAGGEGSFISLQACVMATCPQACVMATCPQACVMATCPHACVKDISPHACAIDTCGPPCGPGTGLSTQVSRAGSG